MQKNSWRLLLLILLPVLVGLLTGQVLLRMPSSYVDIFYWMAPVAMITIWPMVGSRFARIQEWPSWKGILIGNSAIIICMLLCVLLMSIDFSNAFTQGLLTIAQAYAMPMVPLASGMWLFYDSTNLDAYASVIMAVISALLLVGMFSAGYGYRRLHIAKPEEDAQEQE